MSWMITNTGREHHLAGIGQQFNTPSIEEIAHALAQINRFTGHAKRPYSVAEHSLLVASIAEAEGASVTGQLAGLMHDAHKAFTGDTSSPAKWTIGEAWKTFEHSQEIGLHKALGMRATMVSHAASVKRWDLIALATERRDLMRWNPDVNQPWPILDTPGKEVQPITGRLDTPLRANTDWKEWLQMFIEQHDKLQRKIQRARSHQ